MTDASELLTAAATATFGLRTVQEQVFRLDTCECSLFILTGLSSDHSELTILRSGKSYLGILHSLAACQSRRPLECQTDLPQEAARPVVTLKHP